MHALSIPLSPLVHGRDVRRDGRGRSGRAVLSHRLRPVIIQGSKVMRRGRRRSLPFLGLDPLFLQLCHHGGRQEVVLILCVVIPHDAGNGHVDVVIPATLLGEVDRVGGRFEGNRGVGLIGISVGRPAHQGVDPSFTVRPVFVEINPPTHFWVERGLLAALLHLADSHPALRTIFLDIMIIRVTHIQCV